MATPFIAVKGSEVLEDGSFDIGFAVHTNPVAVVFDEDGEEVFLHDIETDKRCVGHIKIAGPLEIFATPWSEWS